jgi:hypothetical protein
MQVYEITGFRTAIDESGVAFLDPEDAFETILDGYVYRQELKSRRGYTQFANVLGDQVGDLPDGTRVMGIFNDTTPLGERETLAVTKKYLYKYDNVVDLWLQVPMAGSVAGTNFGITSNDGYVSGTSYFTKTGTRRFVFTGREMNTIYFYDGTDVKSYILDNPDFQQPAASIGNLIRAKYVVWFNGRINFIVPETTLQTYGQGILYSGIRDGTGNGDKFNVPGSGLFNIDSFEFINGQSIMGDVLILNLQASNWVAEKTTDPFNPYFLRRIPSVTGTDASFSAVQWNYEVKSLGQNGLITTDNRQSLRFDNKLPYFTRNDIDQVDIELTYGGFDRETDQFIFSYRDIYASDTDLSQNKTLVYNYKESTFAFNRWYFSVFGEGYQGIDLAWNDIDEVINPSWLQMNTTEEIWNRIGIGDRVQKTLAGDDFSRIYQLNSDYDDGFSNITGITNAGNAVITLSDPEFHVGQFVYIDNVAGMTEINGKVGEVLSVAGNTITVNINTTLFGVYTSGGYASAQIRFFAKTSPFNPFRKDGRKVYISHIEFLINSDNQNGDAYLHVDINMDYENNIIKSADLFPFVPTQKSKQWLTIVVNQEANFFTLNMSQNSDKAQIVITSIRVHCKEGSITTAA